ncbi:MAG TPA: hypothetical protein VF532_21465 [Candidatus Angelobacter sp.]
MATPTQQPQSGTDVYKELSSDHRFFGDARFKQLTVWSAVTGFLLNAALSDKNSLSLMQHPFILPICGILFTSVFWVMEVRATLHGIEALRSKRRFEVDFAVAPMARWTLFNHTNATLILYVLSYAVWWFLVYHADTKFWLASGPFLALGICLVAFTIREYKDIWIHAWQNWQK